jgi:hypothetical protein
MPELAPNCFLKEFEPGLKIIPDASCWNWPLLERKIVIVCARAMLFVFGSNLFIIGRFRKA